MKINADQSIPLMVQNTPKQETQPNESELTPLAQDELQLSPSKGKASQPLSLFKTEAEQGEARRYLDRFSGGAFDQVRSVDDRLVNLKTSHDQVDLAQPGNYGSEQYYGVNDQGELSTGRIQLDDLNNIGDYETLKEQIAQALANDPNVQAELGSNPTSEELNDYINTNYLAVVQVLGYDLNEAYEGYVSLLGDVDAYSTLNERGGVCSDIHVALAAFHNAYGREAYVMMNSSNDYAHVITLFKDNGKWYIQNYNRIVETDAQTLEELYDQVMPENREIKLWQVNEDGTVSQVLTDHLTATGRAERRFRSEAGVGDFSPWHAAEGVTVGTNGASIYQDGFYGGVNIQTGQMGLAYYQQTVEGTKQTVEGTALEGQSNINQYGYQRQHLDGKYEIESRWDQLSPSKQVYGDYGRTHFSVYAGGEMGVVDPIYWGGEEAIDPAARVGVSYARNASRLYELLGPIKGEVGYQINGTGTLTASTSDPFDPLFVGRMYADSGVEGKVISGIFVQPTADLVLRTGLSSGVDLGKIDGTNVEQQLKNVAEADAYVDVTYGRGLIAFNVLGEIPLQDNTQYKVGVGVAVAPFNTDRLVLAATYLNEQIVNDQVDRARFGVEVKPKANLVVGATFSTSLIGDNAQTMSASGYLRTNFNLKVKKKEKAI